jgi:hypothetical protein
MGAVCLGAVTVFLATPSGAGCFVQNYNSGYSNGTGGRGVRTDNPGMEVADGSVECGRVSSMFVHSSDWTKFVEVGWYEDVDAYTCIPNSNGPPKELAFAHLNSMNGCLGSPAAIAVGTDAFSVRDDNQNGLWTYTHDGTQIWTSFNMGSFNSGNLLNNGERLTQGNTPHADFNGEYRRDATNNWVNWGNVSVYSGSDDPGAKECFYSQTHQAVKLNATSC